MESNLANDPPLVTAALINGVVNDLLYQSDFPFPHFPEWVDLAVIASGLGVLRSGVGFVKKTGLHWDSTAWDQSPRPFLNIPSLAYANAMAAWIRNDPAPGWASELNGEIIRPMRSSLKYLIKTNDSYFGPSDLAAPRGKCSASQWWNGAKDAAPSTRIIALRHLETNPSLDGALDDVQVSIMVDALRSKNRAVVLHAIAATERMNVDAGPVVVELQSLVNDRDDEVRAKSLCALTVLGHLDSHTIEMAVEMLDSHFKHNVFAAVLALSSRDSIDDAHVPSVQRAFMRSLKSCDYEFVGLYARSFFCWFDDPQDTVREWLQDDSPELLDIALAAVEGESPKPVQIATPN